MTQLIKLWKVKLKAVREDERQWTKARNRAEAALHRINREINQLETKIEAAEAKLANAK